MLKPLPPQNRLDSMYDDLTYWDTKDYDDVVDFLIGVLRTKSYTKHIKKFILLLSQLNLLLWEKRNTATPETIDKLKEILDSSINTVIKDLIFVEGILPRSSTAPVPSTVPVPSTAPVPSTVQRDSPAPVGSVAKVPLPTPVLVTAPVRSVANVPLPVPRVSPYHATTMAPVPSTEPSDYFLVDGYGNLDFREVGNRKFYNTHFIDKQHLVNRTLNTDTVVLGRGNFGTVYKGTFADDQGTHDVSVKIWKGNEADMSKEFNIMKIANTKMPEFVVKPYSLTIVNDYDEQYKSTNDTVGVLVSELLDSVNFSQAIKNMTIEEYYEELENLAKKLDILNSHRILHLDTNEGNFLRRKNTNEWTLIDFGRAMYIDETYNVSGNLYSNRPLNFDKFDATYLYLKLASIATKYLPRFKDLQSNDVDQVLLKKTLLDKYNSIIIENLEIIEKNEMLDIFLSSQREEFLDKKYIDHGLQNLFNKDGPLRNPDDIAYLGGKLLYTEWIIEGLIPPLTVHYDVDDRKNTVYFNISTSDVKTKLALSCFRNKKFWVNGTIGKWIPKGAGQYGSVYEASYFSKHLDQPAILKVMMYSNENPESVYASANIKDIQLQKLFYKKLPNGIVKQFDSGKCKAFTANNTIDKTVKVLYVLMEKAQMTFLDFENELYKLPESTETQNKYTEMVTKILKIYDDLNNNGYLHCDSKHDNVVILQDGTPKLIDFGLSTTIDLYKNAFNIPSDTNISFQGFDSLYFIFQLLWVREYHGDAIANFLNDRAIHYANIIKSNQMMYIFKNSVFQTSPVAIGLNLYPEIWPDFLDKDTTGSIIPKSIVLDTFLTISGDLNSGWCSQYLRSVFANEHLLQKIKDSMLLLLGPDDLQNTLEGLKRRKLMTKHDAELLKNTLGYGPEQAVRSDSVCGILGWTPILNERNKQDHSLGKYAYFLHTWGVSIAQCQHSRFVLKNYVELLQETINIIERAVVHVHNTQMHNKSKRVNVLLRVTDLGIGNCPVNEREAIMDVYKNILKEMTNKFKWLTISLFLARLLEFGVKEGIEFTNRHNADDWPIVQQKTVLVVVNEWNPETIIGGSAKNTMNHGIVNGFDPYRNIINASFLHNYFFNKNMRIMDKSGRYLENPATRAPTFVAPLPRPPPPQVEQPPQAPPAVQETKSNSWFSFFGI